MKQYFSYFKWLFIPLGILAVITGIATAVHAFSAQEGYVRKNLDAPSQRVYDYADVLTDTEEEKLEALIAKREAQTGCDIVLVVIEESVLDKYGYTANTDSNWEKAMMRYADDFYDLNDFGYNKVHGDGVLLLDNWYEGSLGSEKGSWLSTCGKVYHRYSSYMIDEVLDDVYYTLNRDRDNAYAAYKTYIENIYREMSGKEYQISLSPMLLFVISLVVAGIFIAVHLKSKEGKKTTTASTYVENGSVKFHESRDELINKFVTKRVIQSDSGGGSRGGGGGHISSSGVSHGGGGRRG